MSAPTITCPSGHVNSPSQKFCGECGVSLAGVCPNGHQNPDGQHYCGECGNSLGQSATKPSPDPEAETAGAATARPAGWYRDPDSPGAEAYWDGSRWRGTRLIQVEAAARPHGTTPPSDRPVAGISAALPVELPPSSSLGSASGSGSRLRGFWPGLTTPGKIAAVAVPGVLLLLLLLVPSLGSGSHSESWKWGYDHAGEAAQFLPNGTSPESACRGTAGMYMRFAGSPALGTMNPPTDKGEATAGCLAALRDMGRIAE
jgi:hypothetical protein